MSYTTEHDTLDLLRDYLNGTLEAEAWDELRAFALDILDAYADRHNVPDPDAPHIFPEDFAV
jgi:hypothetical protein